MKTYFIFSDVHSYFNILMIALSDAGFDENNPDHIIISLGDLLDRGPDAIKCLNFINNFPEDRKILIKGNHEDLMMQAIRRGYFEEHDRHNKTHETVRQVTGEVIHYSDFGASALEAMSKNESWNTYYNSCIDYYELGDNIFVHGWIPSRYEFIEEDVGGHYDWYYNDWKQGNWERARWDNGMKMWAMGIRLPNKTIYCGHYHTSWGHSNLHNDGKEFLERIETMYIDPETGKTEPHARFDPFIDEGIVAIDGCTALTGIVNVVKLEM